MNVWQFDVKDKYSVNLILGPMSRLIIDQR